MPSFHKAGEILILTVIDDEKIFLYGFYGTVLRSFAEFLANYVKDLHKKLHKRCFNPGFV